MMTCAYRYIHDHHTESSNDNRGGCVDRYCLIYATGVRNTQ
jgi:hypothetical protein